MNLKVTSRRWTPDPAPTRGASSSGVLEIRLTRPDVANALDDEVAVQLAQALADVDDSVAAVLLVADGPRFCAGGDLDAMLSAADPVAYVRSLATELDKTFRTLQSLSVPVVAAVQGAVAGAGLALMLSCDLVVASADTRFVAGYAGVGLTPDCGLSWLLPRAVGHTRATSFLLGNRPIAASTALEWGLVAEVVDSGEHEVAAQAHAAEFASGVHYATTKSLLLSGGDRRSVGTAEAAAIAAAVALPGVREKMERFRRV